MSEAVDGVREAMTPFQQFRMTLDSEEWTSALAAASASACDVERFKLQAVAAIRAAADRRTGRNPLLECSRTSLFLALQWFAASGLDLSPASGHGAIVPHGNEATVILMYKGLIALAMRHPKIVAVDAGAIREGDEWEWVDGTSPRLSIRREAGGRAVAWYAVTHYAGGVAVPVVMNRDEIIEHRRKFPGGAGGKLDFDGMALKTVVRRAAKMWPIELPPG
jgi:recombination protein RecT